MDPTARHLCLHDVAAGAAAGPTRRLALSPEVLRACLVRELERGAAASLADCLTGPLGPDRFTVSFDDAHVSVPAVAAPELAARGILGTRFGRAARWLAARWLARAPWLGALVVIALTTGRARADVLDFSPRTDCVRGAHSALVGGGHGVSAACVPSAARADWPCLDGRRIEVVGLELGRRHVAPPWDGRRGPMPSELAEAGYDYLVVEAGCEPPAGAPVLEARAPTGEGLVEASLPPETPAGCHAVRVWLDDPSFACQPPPTTASAPAPSPAPPAAASAPAPSPGPPPGAASPSASAWGCAAGRRGGLLGLVALPLALALARRRRRRGG